MQILKTAIDAEKTRKTDPPADRVIRFTSLRDGIRKASNQRVADLTKEYVHLREYLALLKQSEPTGTRREFSERLRRRWQNVRKAGRAVKGAPAGALHAGPGGWGKVIGELETVGVLGPYRRTVSWVGVRWSAFPGLGRSLPERGLPAAENPPRSSA